MNIEKMREEFKAWESDADDGPQTDPLWLMFDSALNQFALIDVQQRWKAWQASRESLVIELPAAWSHIGNEYRQKTASHIEGQGLKVKL